LSSNNAVTCNFFINCVFKSWQEGFKDVVYQKKISMCLLCRFLDDWQVNGRLMSLLLNQLMLYLPWLFSFHWGLQVTKFGVEEDSKGLNPCIETKLIMHVHVHTSHKPKLAYIRWLKLQPSSISLVWFVHVAWKFKEKDVSLKKNEYGKTSIIFLQAVHMTFIQ